MLCDWEVIATALQMQNGLDLEIWDHKRFIIRLTGKARRSRKQNNGE